MELQLYHLFGGSELGGKDLKPIKSDTAIKYFKSLSGTLSKDICKNSTIMFDEQGSRIDKMSRQRFFTIFKSLLKDKPSNPQILDHLQNKYFPTTSNIITYKSFKDFLKKEQGEEEPEAEQKIEKIQFCSFSDFEKS